MKRFFSAALITLFWIWLLICCLTVASLPAVGQVITGPSYFVTASTIVATWTTNISADTHMQCGGKLAADDGYAANGTSHQAVVEGLFSQQTYSCTVTSGSTTSSPSNQTTSAQPTRIPIRSAQLGNPTQLPSTGIVHGDTNFTFVDSGNLTKIIDCDGYGFVSGTPNAGANMQLATLTNETTFVGTPVNLLTAYGPFNTFTGTDGPTSAALTNKVTGLWSMRGNLYIWATRQANNGGAWYNNIIKSTDNGASWNNYLNIGSPNANGLPTTPTDQTHPFPLASKTYGWVQPIRYGVDDGTLGYTTSTNGVDGANAYIYQVFVNSPFTTPSDQVTPAYMLRQLRIKVEAQDYSGTEYWIGTMPSPTPADFVNDANWSTSDASKTAIFTPSPADTWPFITFIEGINYYLLSTNGKDPNANTWTLRFFAGPTPVGPWTAIGNQGGVQQYYGPIPVHRDTATNAATDNIPIRIVYSGAGPALAFTTYYYPTVSTLTLSTTKTLPAFIQSNSAAPGTASTYPVAFPANVTAGDLITVVWRRTTAGASFSSITDSLGTSFTQVYELSDGGTTTGGFGVGFAPSSGADTVNVNFTASISGGLLSVAEYTGVNASRTFPAGKVATTQTPVSNAVTATAGDLLVGVDEHNASQTVLNAGTGYLQRERSTAVSAFFTSIEDNLNAAGGSTTAGFTGNTTGGTTAGIGAFFLTAFSISGNAGSPGSTINWTGASGSGSVVADGSSNYSIPNLVNGSYVLTPSKAGFIFTPTTSNQTISGANITGVNFTATQVSSGQVSPFLVGP
jgi:hypothetical protein